MDAHVCKGLRVCSQDELDGMDSFTKRCKTSVPSALCDHSCLHRPPGSEPTLQGHPGLHVSAGAGEEGGHHFRRSLLSSRHGGRAKSILHLYTTTHTVH